MKLIIQIPCYNEEETLPMTIAQLPRHVPGYGGRGTGTGIHRAGAAAETPEPPRIVSKHAAEIESELIEPPVAARPTSQHSVENVQ